MDDRGDYHDLYDVLVIGAGPAGCEAAAAAARAGAKTLCLGINLDSIALHPAGPVLADTSEDPRTILLGELREAGGLLPRILSQPGTTARDLPEGMVVIDRRRVSLAYKERLESFPDALWLRQALVTSLRRTEDIWIAGTRLEESFKARCVVIATGTFLRGMVHEAGVSFPGGRHGEIPSNALAACLEELGMTLEPATATCYARIGSGAPGSRKLPPDGDTLHELYALGVGLAGSRAEALAAARATRKQVWLNRAQFTVSHQIISANQLDTRLQAPTLPGLFFAGRTAGSCNYVEAAALGLVAGSNAATASRTPARYFLTKSYKFVDKLVAAVACQESRPVTVRRPPPGC